MSPSTWSPVRRADGELIGYLEAADGSDVVTPLTLFGVALGPAGTPEDAEAVLEARGLASLSEPWLLLRDDGSEIRVAVLAAYPDRVVVVDAPYGFADPSARPTEVAAEDGARRLRPYG